MAPSLRTFIFQVFPVAITFLLLVISFVLLGVSVKDPQQSGSINEWLIPLNIVVLLILSILIVYNVVRALRRLRSRKAGSRFTLRLLTAFSILTILPVLLVSYFSMNFIGDRIDNWFNVKIEGALDDSLELARSSLEVRMRQHLLNLERIGAALTRIDDFEYGLFIDQQMKSLGAYELVLFGGKQEVLAHSGQDVGALLPHFPKGDILRRLSSRGYMYQLEPVGNDGLFSRVAITLSMGVARETLILTALFPFSEKERILADSVQDTYNQYQEISYQKDLIKKGFRITLLLVMLLSILFSIWAAFVYSLRLTKPVRKLLEATNAVASGDLKKKLPVEENDDFSLLARSFNTMTTRLSMAQNQSAKSQQQVQRQHDYLNIVLGSLTSGVITLDEDFSIQRINPAAEQIFHADLTKYRNKSLKELCTDNKYLLPFYTEVMPHLIKSAKNGVNNNNKEWQTEINLLQNNSRTTIVCRGTILPELVDGSHGYVLVIEDITEVVQAQHDAAWAEVARRLAHEIKNPLTPIQLSAERLLHRLKPLLKDDSADLLHRMSNTIIQQVDSMKKMVDAFSEYARVPELKLASISINSLITEVVELYRVNQANAQIKLDLHGNPTIYADADRMRQLLVNLMKNAIEAMQNQSTDEGSTLTISTSTMKQPDRDDMFMLKIIDNGPGIDGDMLPHVFEPYKSSKPKGGGLGLAIVKRIVDEHQGKINAKNNQSGGASFIVYLPLSRG